MKRYYFKKDDLLTTLKGKPKLLVMRYKLTKKIYTAELAAKGHKVGEYFCIDMDTLVGSFYKKNVLKFYKSHSVNKRRSEINSNTSTTYQSLNIA